MRKKQDWSPRQIPSDRPLNAQPKWEFVGNLGDVNPLDYGGYFVYEDSTGVYEAEAALIQPDENGDNYTILRINLERYKIVDGHMVPIRYDPSWPRPIEHYQPWFHDKLREIAESNGISYEELVSGLTSPDALTLARAYHDLADYLGWVEFDSYPLTPLTRAQVQKKYRKELRKIKEAR